MKMFVELTHEKFGPISVNVDSIEMILTVDKKTTITLLKEVIFVKESRDEILELIRGLL